MKDIYLNKQNYVFFSMASNFGEMQIKKNGNFVKWIYCSEWLSPWVFFAPVSIHSEKFG